MYTHAHTHILIQSVTIQYNTMRCVAYYLKLYFLSPEKQTRYCMVWYSIELKSKHLPTLKCFVLFESEHGDETIEDE